MAKKWGIEFDGVDAYLEQLKQYEGAAEKAVENALKATQQLVADKCAAAMPMHRRTGRTAESIITDADVVWTGQTAEIDVGFRISDGGLASIFLMYGTKSGIEQDKELYNAVYGSQTKKQAAEIQQEAFDKVAREVMK